MLIILKANSRLFIRTALRLRRRVLVVLGVLVCLNTVAWVVVWDLARPRFLEVVFFDVGQGDAIFIETAQRYQILIDGGPDLTVLEKLAKEMPFYDRTIDLSMFPVLPRNNRV